MSRHTVLDTEIQLPRRTPGIDAFAVRMRVKDETGSTPRRPGLLGEPFRVPDRRLSQDLHHVAVDDGMVATHALAIEAG